MITALWFIGIIVGIIIVPYLVGIIAVIIGSGDIDLSDEFMNFWLVGAVVLAVVGGTATAIFGLTKII